MALADDLVTQLVQAKSDDTAWGIVSGRPRATLEVVADLLYVDPDGMGDNTLRRAIVREARA
jgi:hypothetical protein